jgi:hypothetical protein
MSGDATSATVTLTTTVATTGDASVTGSVGELIPDPSAANNTVSVTAAAPPPPPAPPPAPVVVPVVGRFTLAPVVPTAGKRVTISTTIRPTRAGVAVHTLIGGVRTTHTASRSNGELRVSLPIPRTARGKELRVTIAATADGRTTSRAATYRVR